MFSSSYTSTRPSSPTIEDWAKKVNNLEDRVEPAINDMQTRLGMGITPIALKNRELQLIEQGAEMKETYKALSDATRGIQQISDMKIIPYISPLLSDETEEEKKNKQSTKTIQMVSKPSGNDFLEGE
jgi:hypothetical protein